MMGEYLMKLLKKSIAVFLTMILLSAILTCHVVAAENAEAECFRFDYSTSDIKAQYAEWYFSDYATANVTRDTGTMNVQGVAVKRGGYQNYDCSFEILLSENSYSKTYFASKFIIGELMSLAPSGLTVNDLPSWNKNSRPGYMGAMLGLGKDGLEVVVHTYDTKSDSGYGNINATFSLPEGVEIQKGFTVRVVDTGNCVEYYVKDTKIASVIFTAGEETDHIHAEILDANGTKLAETAKAHVNLQGTIGFISRGSVFKLKNIRMTALSGNAADSILKEIYFDHDSIWLEQAEEAETTVGSTETQPETSVGTSSDTEKETLAASNLVSGTTGLQLDTTEICVLIMFNVTCIGIAVGVYIMVDKRKVVLLVLAASFIVSVVGDSLMGAGVIDIHDASAGQTILIPSQTGDNITQPDHVIENPSQDEVEDVIEYPLYPDRTHTTLDAKGNTPQVTVISGDQRAQDMLGRDLPTYEEVGPTKEGKYVGIFYCTWTTSATRELNDNSRIWAQNPRDPQMGTAGEFHWWAEPEEGYSDAADPWVIRRNLYYLNMAGIDYIYIDCTNGYVYEEALEALLDTSLEMRAEGLNTPSIVFWCFGDDSGTYRDAGYLYRRYYSQEKYKSLWFYMDGKPLMTIKRVEPTVSQYTDPLHIPVLNNQDMVDFFTFRFAWVPTRGNDGHWPGESVYRWSWNCPLYLYYASGTSYSYGWDENRRYAEQITLAVGGHCNSSGGKSAQHGGALDKFLEKPTSGEGLHLEDQFDFVMSRHPETEYLNIQGWNEWIAQYFPEHLVTGATQFGFVDNFNREMSRDMGPIKGSYSDSYFYQLCSIVRRFKGMDAPVTQENDVTIDINGSLGQWNELTGTYTDYLNDTTWRDGKDPTGVISYINQTGRNDIIRSKVAYDAGNVYFYVETAESMTPYTDHNWMLLFIDADDNAETGWEGYDFLVNYEVLSETQTVICQYIDDIWQEIGVINYKQSGSKMQIAIPRSLIGETGEKVSFGFHWNDNVSNVYDLECWFLEGDNAPERRNMYVFSADKAYDASFEKTNPVRNESDAIRYMKPVAANADGLKEGLWAEKYWLVEDYGKQPEINLLMNAYGTEGNRIWSGVKQQIGLISEEARNAFAISFDGYIWIPEDAEVTFTLNSDDGTCLYINNRLVIDNSGVHGAQTASESIRLGAGLHEIRLEYFENGNGNSVLEFACTGSDYRFYCD